MLIPYALRGEELVDPQEYDTGGRKPGIVCPGCKEPLVAKIGEVRVPHFAHLPDRGAKCEYRTVLHRVAVRLLARRVGELLRTQAGLFVRWKCPTCGLFHRINVLDGIKTAAMARQVGPVRPDLSLFAGEAQDQPPRGMVHLGAKPASADKLAVYRAQNIPVWLLRPPETLADATTMKDTAELLAVDVLGVECPQPEPAAAPTVPSHPPRSVASSPAPVYPGGCPACGKNLKRRYLYVQWRYPELHTWEDDAIVMLDGFGKTLGPGTFTARELQVAEEHGANTTDRGRLYYANAAEILQTSQPVGSYSQGCPHCGTVVPDRL